MAEPNYNMFDLAQAALNAGATRQEAASLLTIARFEGRFGLPDSAPLPVITPQGWVPGMAIPDGWVPTPGYRNPFPGSVSSAVGPFQAVDLWFLRTDSLRNDYSQVRNLSWQVSWALKVFRANGFTPWVRSAGGPIPNDMASALVLVAKEMALVNMTQSGSAPFVYFQESQQPDPTVIWNGIQWTKLLDNGITIYWDASKQWWVDPIGGGVFDPVVGKWTPPFEKKSVAYVIDVDTIQAYEPALEMLPWDEMTYYAGPEYIGPMDNGATAGGNIPGSNDQVWGLTIEEVEAIRQQSQGFTPTSGYPGVQATGGYIDYGGGILVYNPYANTGPGFTPIQ